MVFGRPVSVLNFVALNGKDETNSELEMWKATMVTHLRRCSAIYLKGMEKPHSFQKFSTSLQQT